MTGFLLDTNVPSELTRTRPDPHVQEWVASRGDALYMSVVSLGELRKGIALLPNGDGRRLRLERWFSEGLVALFAERILPVTQAIAERWGALEASRQMAGRPLSTADGQIAATALEHDLVLVTRNIQDFANLGVSLVNPWSQL